jgi:hypothetical protein
MLQGGYRLGDDIMDQFDPKVTPQEPPVFRPETRKKYQYPTPYGICAPGGTPTSITTQATEHGPMELIQKPGVVWILTEFPQTIRWIPTDGRPHSPSPDVTFNGESVGHWEGDTLVVDTTNFYAQTSLNGSSPNLHVVERFRRVDADTLLYEFTVDDPTTWVRPWTAQVPMIRNPEPMYEYACHEGNYGMTGILSGARFLEKEEAAR